ncbi:MAG: uroporphyrinogen decarboxylase family protein [Eubacteriales bacterium]
MTKRERIITAMSHGVPDRIPVAPDFSAMIPCRRSGLPFYDVLLYGKQQLWKLYLDACKYFGTEAWFIYGAIGYKYENSSEHVFEVEKLENRRLISISEIKTPAGSLYQKGIHFEDECDTAVEKMIKNLRQDLPKMKYIFPKAVGYDRTVYDEQVKALGDEGVMAVTIMPPGLHIFNSYFDGSLEAAVVAYYEEPELFHELCEMYERQQMSHLEIALDLKVDSILTGGSGSITLQSPAIWEELSLPFLKKATEMCSQAGVISGIHSCGKEMHVVKTCAEMTKLDYINPLEIAPMGDCDLAECKRLYGDKLCLMGNLHTTNVMLSKNKNLVRLESLKAIRDAGENGNFVLSTGDQCGRDTPDENIIEMVNVSKEFGEYPLNIERIECEIERLEKQQNNIYNIKDQI